MATDSNCGCDDNCPENDTSCPPCSITTDPLTLQYRNVTVCCPAKIIQDCEAPVIPPYDCEGEIQITPNPGNPDAPFTILTYLFDENCNKILDENSNPITTDIT